MGTRGKLERKIKVSFRVASDNSGIGECDGGVQFWVFRCGGDQSKVKGRNPDSDS